MRCGLFGKLPAKRDFVAISSPRAFLDAWEPWMQAGVSASRETLGDSWRQAFLTAPIWRFWLGTDICDTTMVGAFMSSLDGVGRYYPLTVFACADPGSAIAPPDIDAQDDWFAAAEEFLLATLEAGIEFETITTALEGTAPPVCAANSVPDGMVRVTDGTVVAPATAHSFLDTCNSLRRANHLSAYAATSFWWTLGGGDYQPLALSCHGMPEPVLFSNMLTGEFSRIGFIR